MILAHIMLWLTAIIWGSAFVAQSTVTNLLEPNSFNAARFALATITLIPLLYLFPHKQDYQARSLILKGTLLGTVLFTGFGFQQTGLLYVSAGDAGFISSTYIIIVPIIGLAFGEKISRDTWIGIIFAVAGLYTLCIGPNFSINHGDIIELTGAFFWACHLLLISKLSKQFPPIPLAITQFSSAAILASISALLFEQPRLSHFTQEWLPLLYSSLIALGLASLFQIMGQKHVSATISALILSSAAVFAVISDWLFLGTSLSSKSYIGCGLILIGLSITIIRFKRKNKTIKKTE